MKKPLAFVTAIIIFAASAICVCAAENVSPLSENDIVFFGDSTTAHMKLRGGIPAERVWSGKANTVLFRTVCEGKPIYFEDEERAVSLAEAVREKQPKIPYIMISLPDFDKSYNQSIARRDVVIDTYRYAREAGDRHVYYVDGQGIFRGPDEELCTVEGTHPNDMGFMKMAETIERVLRRSLRHGYLGN